MQDVLYELSLLSERLQKRNVTILYADGLIRHCIKHQKDMKQEKGEKIIEAEQAIEKMAFNSVKLTDCKKIKSINYGQLLTNIINKIKTPLIPEAAEEGGRNAAAIQIVLSEICVLDTSIWLKKYL